MQGLALFCFNLNIINTHTKRLLRLMRICHSWRPLAKYEEAKIGLLKAFAVLNRNNKLCSLTANSFVPGAFGETSRNYVKQVPTVKVHNIFL